MPPTLTEKQSAPSPMVLRGDRVEAVTPAWAWVGLAVALGVWFGFKGWLTRFPEWDESVFFSQSGGFNGNGAPPSPLVASRESGPAVLIGLIRAFGLEVTGTRIVVAALNTGVLLVACRRLERHFGAWVGVLTAVFFGFTWMFAVYGSSFFAAVPASVLALLMFALYLDFRVSVSPRRAGLALGLATVVALWFRPFETLVVVAVLGLHSLVVKPGVTWRERLDGVGVTAATVVGLFVVPWSIDSMIRYGGVSNRFSSAGGQGYTLRPGIRIMPYLDRLGGAQNAWNPFSPFPAFGYATAWIVVLAVTVVGVVGIVRSWRSGKPYGLIAVLALASISFYLFISTVLADRYLIHGLVFFCLGAAIVTVAGLNSRFPLAAVGVVGVVTAIWFTAQLSVVDPYQEAEAVNNEKISAFGVALDEVLPQDCIGVTRFGAPQWQLATTCDFEAAVTLEQALETIENHRAKGSVAVLIWPTDDGEAELYGPGWQTLHVPIVENHLLAVGIRGLELSEEQVMAIESTVHPGP